MNDKELIDEMVQRLGKELKGLLLQVQAGQVPVATVELAMRERLRAFSANEITDQYWCGGGCVQVRGAIPLQATGHSVVPRGLE